MRKIDSDMLTIMLVGEFLKGSGKRIEDVIPEFNKDKYREMARELPFMQSEKAEEVLIQLARESYRRIEKKFKGEKK